MRHNLTFFGVNKKLKYYNWTNSTVVNTGLSLTADFTSIIEVKGDLFATNTVDGLYYVNISKLTASAASGASAIFIGLDAAVRLSGIGLPSGTIRVGEDNYTYTAVNITTGEITLSGTLSSTYPAGTVTVRTHSYSSLPKGSKLAYWAESLNIIGVEGKPYTYFYSDFYTDLTLTGVVNFPAGNTNTIKTKLVDLVATKDYLYLFTESETYSVALAQINTFDGSRITQLFSAQYGILAPNAYCLMDSSIAWITQNKRIMYGELRLEAGAISIDIAEQFDAPIKKDLERADFAQSKVKAYYMRSGKEAHFKISLEGQTVEFIFDNNIKAWCPPDTNKYFIDFFERGELAYATAENDDTVYLLNSGIDDDGGDIESVIAFGEFEGEDGRVTSEIKPISVSGTIGYGTTITYSPRMNYQDGTTRTISFLSGASVESDTIGSFGIGLSTIGGSGIIETEREFDEKLGNFPAIVRSFQPIFKTSGENSFFSIRSWSLLRKDYSDFITTTK